MLAVLAVLVVTGILYQRIGSRRDGVLFPPPGELIDVGGHRLHAVCHGEGGPAVLLESGIAASSLSWAVVQPAIAAFTRVWAYDRAGLAWSEPASCPRSFGRIVDELSVVLASVAPTGRIVLVGHSFGSFVVRAFAARQPERVVGLVLIDPPTEWLTMTPRRTRLLRGARRLSRLGGLLAHVGVVRISLALLSGGAPGAPRQLVKVFGPTATRTLERLVGEVRKLPPDVHPIIQALWCQPKCFRAMADHLLTLERDGTLMATTLQSRDIPVVVISGADQPPEQLERHRRLADSSVGGRHIVAARSAHWIQFDEPDLIVSVVRELVELERSKERARASTDR
jgi:pimeloyl-ACP methyl ester carboxylesterase